MNTSPDGLESYKNYKYRVKWDGKYVAGISKISALKRTTEMIEHHEKTEKPTKHYIRKAPGRTKFAAIILERGISQDMEFENWANNVWRYSNRPSSDTSKDFRKDVTIEVFNELGQLIAAYKLYRCWISEYQALPNYDGNANVTAIEYIKLENEGWERDRRVDGPPVKT